MEPSHHLVDAALVPRFAGLATFMRLPLVASADGLDMALYGIPWDGGSQTRRVLTTRSDGHIRITKEAGKGFFINSNVTL